jgi:hypothetical protein
VNNGLTLHSTYSGRGQPVNQLTVTASNTTAGETATSTPQIITVTDSPAGSGLPNAYSLSDLMAQFSAQNHGLDHAVALFNQYMAGFPEQHGGQITTNALSQITTNEQHFLANPHHG